MKKVFAADFAVIMAESKWLFLLPVLYAVLGISNMFLRAFTLILVGTIIMNVMAYNERSGFDKYMCILPIKRANVAIARYVEALAMFFALTAVQYIGYMILKKPMSFSEVGILSGLFFIYIAILFPFLIKYGVEKGRTIYLFGMIIIGGSVGAMASISPMKSPIIVALTWLVPIVGIIALVVSAGISIKLVENRDL